MVCLDLSCTKQQGNNGIYGGADPGSRDPRPFPRRQIEAEPGKSETEDNAERQRFRQRECDVPVIRK
jgi:hypothetical protein